MVVCGKYHHVHLVSRDPETTASWYVKALGGVEKTRRESKGSLNIIVMLGDAQLSVRGLRPGEAVTEKESASPPGIHHIGLMVDDIEIAVRDVSLNGGTIVEPVQTGSSGNLIAFVQSPEGVLFELLQAKTSIE